MEPAVARFGPLAACRIAAEEGDATAQFTLGKHYYFGDQVEKDLDQAARWFTAAAEQGVPGAQFYLGYMYDDGVGIAQDATLAAKWYRAAAEQGHPEAQENLGRLYWHGRGVPRDRKQGLSWVDRAYADPDDFRRVIHTVVRTLVTAALVLAALLVVGRLIWMTWRS